MVWGSSPRLPACRPACPRARGRTDCGISRHREDRLDRERRLATTTLSGRQTKPSPALPDVPTALAQGVKGFEAASWNAIYAKASTPAEMDAQMRGQIAKWTKWSTAPASRSGEHGVAHARHGQMQQTPIRG